MLVWPMAAKAPSPMEAMASAATTCCHCGPMPAKAPSVTRISSAIAAALGAAAKKVVTGVGAPS